MRVMHCGLWQKATTVYTLFSPPSFDELRRQVVMVLECPYCQKITLSWYGITHQGQTTPVQKISQSEFDSCWRHRIVQDQVPDVNCERQRLFVSQYSRSVARSADKASHYLRQLK
jgi:hypothetical protein